MKEEYVMRLTRKGQVTIPAAVRRLLGVQPNEQVAFSVEDGEVKLRPARGTLEAIYGMVKPLSRPEDLDRLIEIAHEERAEQIANKDREL